MERVEDPPVTKTSHSVVVPQRVMTMESSTCERSFKDITVILTQSREVTVNIDKDTEPESSIAMVSAITKLSHVVLK